VPKPGADEYVWTEITVCRTVYILSANDQSVCMELTACNIVTSPPILPGHFGETGMLWFGKTDSEGASRAWSLDEGQDQ
jgi:hypothetical protein